METSRRRNRATRRDRRHLRRMMTAIHQHHRRHRHRHLRLRLRDLTGRHHRRRHRDLKDRRHLRRLLTTGTLLRPRRHRRPRRVSMVLLRHRRRPMAIRHRLRRRIWIRSAAKRRRNRPDRPNDIRGICSKSLIASAATPHPRPPLPQGERGEWRRFASRSFEAVSKVQGKPWTLDFEHWTLDLLRPPH